MIDRTYGHLARGSEQALRDRLGHYRADVEAEAANGSDAESRG
jgi:hypothetical protein